MVRIARWRAGGGSVLSHFRTRQPTGGPSRAECDLERILREHPFTALLDIVEGDPADSTWPSGHSACPPRWRKLPGPLSESRCGTRRNPFLKGRLRPKAPSGRRRLFPMRNPSRQGREFVLWQRKQGVISPARGGEKRLHCLSHMSHMSQVQNSNVSDGFRCHRSSQVVTGRHRSPPGGPASATANVHVT
ncbi:hypothetical protein Pan44_38640 [Caulifigura coniformis]|uniref:Uncharacterized protein n=1 Tax=Caulifigura coniformis TaxID=2527983 RepID=A0A517SI65_9PLAN|nr:hypothetical protein Pan44_38640 [Caulifigura coniformis]